jgi:hypothetical protein
MRALRIYLLISACAAAQSEAPSGRWDAIVSLDGLKIPFSMQLDSGQNGISGTFVNGGEKAASSSGTFSEGVLHLTFSQYKTTLDAKVGNGALKGTYGGAAFGKHDVEGGAYCTCANEGEAGPDIAGSWTVHTADAAPLTGWRLTVERKGDDTIVHLLRPDDANGALSGRFDGLTFMLHHFDGARASLMELEPRPDGSLDITLKEPRAAVKKFHATKVVP